MKFIASLPWYDHPVSAPALDRFWETLRNRLLGAGLKGAPHNLNRSIPLVNQWQNPGLVLSQCCGPDLFTTSAGKVSCLGRPVFTDLDCPPGYYYSHIVSRDVLVSNPCVAINSLTSWSGNTALKQWLLEHGVEYSRCVITGSHQGSLNLLRQGQVDLIAVDGHTWTSLDHHGVNIIGRSGLALTPPYISGIENEQAREIIKGALAESLIKEGDNIGISELLDASEAIYRPFVPINEVDLNTLTFSENFAV